MSKNKSTGAFAEAFCAIATGVFMNSPSVHQTVYWFASAGRRAWLGLSTRIQVDSNAFSAIILNSGLEADHGNVDDPEFRR